MGTKPGGPAEGPRRGLPDVAAFDHSVFRQEVGLHCELFTLLVSEDGCVRDWGPAEEDFLGLRTGPGEMPRIESLFPALEHAFVARALSETPKGDVRGGMRFVRASRGQIVRASVTAHAHRPPAGSTWVLAVPSRVAAEKALGPEDPLLRPSDVNAFYDDLDSRVEERDDKNMHWGLYERDDEPLPDAAERLMREFFRPLPLEGRAVLDIGCGAGRSAVALARDFGCSSVDGITISPRQVTLSSQLAAAHRADGRAQFHRMDAHDLQFRENSFDVAYAMESIFHMDRERVFREVKRVLKPGGLFAYCDFYPIDGVIRHHRSVSANYVGVDESMRLLRKEGFGRIRFDDWTDRVQPNLPLLYGELDLLARFTLKRGLDVETALEFVERRGLHAKLTENEKSLVREAVYLASIGSSYGERERETVGYGYYLARA